MCGIVGYIGKKDCVSFLIEGLKRVEYRGYDSAGIVVCDEKANKLFRGIYNFHTFFCKCKYSLLPANHFI